MRSHVTSSTSVSRIPLSWSQLESKYPRSRSPPVNRGHSFLLVLFQATDFCCFLIYLALLQTTDTDTGTKELSNFDGVGFSLGPCYERSLDALGGDPCTRRDRRLGPHREEGLPAICLAAFIFESCTKSASCCHYF